MAPGVLSLPDTFRKLYTGYSSIQIILGITIRVRKLIEYLRRWHSIVSVEVTCRVEVICSDEVYVKFNSIYSFILNDIVQMACIDIRT